MKIRFKLETGFDCDEDKPNATLVVEVIDTDFGVDERKQSFAIARRCFEPSDTFAQAKWAGRTLAAALRQLVPEAERFEYPFEDL